MFNLTTNAWSVLEPISSVVPTSRAFHAASYRSGKLYVHGGNDYLLGNNQRGGTSFMKLCGLDDLWSFDVSSKVWDKIHGFEGTCSGISTAYSRKQLASGVVLIFVSLLSILLLDLF
jgi:hypothetical protein